MVEKITITPQEVRGLGDIISPKTTSDFEGETIYQSTSIIGGVETPIFSFNNDNISIVASNPYMLSGEDTDLTVTLHNGLGEPLPNKSITISDGSSLYSGLTNLNGIFTLYNVSVSQDTTFTATYSNVSDSVTVWYDVDFIDYGVTNNHNTTNYFNTSHFVSFNVGDDGTVLSNTTTNARNLYAIKNTETASSSTIQTWTNSLIIELDVLSYTGNSFLQVGDNTNNFNYGWSEIGVGHYRYEISPNSQKLYLNGTQVKSQTLSLDSTTYVRFRFGQNTNVKIRNFVISESV